MEPDAPAQISEPNGKQETESHPKPKLQVVVTRGSITDVKTPVAVIGGYKGIAPAGALKSLDNALQQWITRAGDHGMIGGNLGELFFVPVLHKELAAGSVLLAGMGEYGKFNYHDLCYLAMNICYAVSALKLNSFATVLIGSGEGNLEVEEAVKGLLSGFCDALHHVDPQERVAKFYLVEYNKARYADIVRVLKDVIAEEHIPNIDVTMTEEVVRTRKGKRATVTPTPSRASHLSQFVNRITIERGEDGYSFSALTNSAVVPVREVEVQPFFTTGIATQLRKGESEESHETFGLLLLEYIFPEDFERMIDDGKSLTLVVDKDTAALPWEMACYGPKHRRTYFGTDLRLTRQFRTMLSGAPGIAPPLNKSLRVLVIADPAPDPDLRLSGALQEGQEVVRILKEQQEQLRGQLDIEIVSCLGPEQCDPIKILALLLNETFDVVHYSGHARFDEDKPNRSGWVFSSKVTLSAREIFRARQVPRVVFANACFSAVTNRGQDSTVEQTNQKLAGLAEAFFARGVQNYIGTGWEVDDAAALEFAQVFYTEAMKGKLLGDALADARRKIFNAGSTWGAYQHYGQSSARIVEAS
ncbi:MAG TPA: CHAT domain-containing protein [Pyrinomonadaceae bacterium]|nr:CHAT domain-containing protein [Pyrinomonadaceae bacterium]